MDSAQICQTGQAANESIADIAACSDLANKAVVQRLELGRQIRSFVQQVRVTRK